MAGNITTIGSVMRLPGVPGNPVPPPSQTGAHIAKLAGQAAGVAATFEKARQEDAVASAQSEALKALNDAAFEANRQNHSDFEAITGSFADQAREIGERTAGALETEAEKRAFNERFAVLAESRRVAVRNAAFGRAREINRQRLINDLDDLARDAGGDPATGHGLAAVAEKMIEGHIGAGWIDKQIGRELAGQFRETTARFRVLTALETNPDLAADILDKVSGDLDPRARLRLTATIERERGDRQSALTSTLRADLGEIRDAIKMGVVPHADTFARARQMAIETGNDVVLESLDDLRAGADFALELSSLPLAEAERRVGALAGAARTGASGEEVARLRQGQAMVARMERDLADDPLSFDREVRGDAFPGLDVNAGAADFLARAGHARAVAEHYGVPVKYFTDGERALLAGRLNDDDVNVRGELAVALAAGFGAHVTGALAELGEKDGLNAYIAEMAVNIGIDEARAAWRGQDAIRQKAVTRPSRSDTATVIDDELGNALDSSQAGTRSLLLKTAEALYASRALDQGLEEFDEDQYRAALQVASGRKRNGRGGIGEYNGHKVILPPNLNEGEMAGLLRSLKPAALTELSASKGAPVHVNGLGERVPATVSDIRNGFLISVGQGRYRVSVTNPAERPTQELRDNLTGLYYILDLSDVSPATHRYFPVGLPAELDDLATVP